MEVCPPGNHLYDSKYQTVQVTGTERGAADRLADRLTDGLTDWLTG
jgi:hypothetical protein